VAAGQQQGLQLAALIAADAGSSVGQAVARPVPPRSWSASVAIASA
jgi:hypothetical protein